MPERRQESFWLNITKPGTSACAVFCGILGVAAALCMLLIGFWKTILLAVCFGGGWFFGAVKDKPAFAKKWLEILLRKSNK